MPPGRWARPRRSPAAVLSPDIREYSLSPRWMIGIEGAGKMRERPCLTTFEIWYVIYQHGSRMNDDRCFPSVAIRKTWGWGRRSPAARVAGANPAARIQGKNRLESI